MRIKKFRGKSIVEALDKVKKEFGENAVILSSEKVKTEEGHIFEITAAIDQEEVIFKKEPDIEEETKNDEVSFDYFKQELAEIKEMLKKALSPQLKNWNYLKLLEKGIPAFIAKDIIEKQLELEEYISLKLKEKGSIPNSKYQVFIGEGGVGKTTNIFKLAIWYKYKYKTDVLVLSLDTYKIGGIFQTKRLAELLEIDFEILDIEDFKEIGVPFNKYDYVLIDTPGLNKKFGISDLEDLIIKLPFLRFYWVVKATEHYEYILRLWRKIEKLPVEGILLTFTDKISNSLPILWLLDDRFPPLIFISIGERLPEDIMRAEEDVLLNLFLRGIE
ncbi:hypothetical protein [Thermodesulfobacterium hydrogeniphilum]|uniref:flagellar biosynthesis protein FlhF n=1 Tax=Thermodesulfobacterium hydrogeniphilum TaxID=161156 RepID=UPI00056F5B49|nr:hypothetical protein [Thermodesulfobacterium hydrogeniphilum]